MDTLAWSVENQHTWYGKLAIWLLYRLVRNLMPKGILLNWMTCTAYVQGLHRLYDPKVIVCLDGLRDAGNRAKEIAARGDKTFWLAGNQLEQELFLSLFGSDKEIFRFSVSENTLDQAEKVIAKAEADGVGVIGFIDYEFHVARTFMTLVRQAKKHGSKLRFVPYAYVDNNRRDMYPPLREFGTLVEAWKLWRYQRKGDVASLQEAMDY